MVPKTGLEPVRCKPPRDFKSRASADSATSAKKIYGLSLFKESPIFWRRHPDLNRGMRILQTLALPLGYGAAVILRYLCTHIVLRSALMERKTGFEPATSTLARSHSTTESLPHMPAQNPPARFHYTPQRENRWRPGTRLELVDL